VEAMLIPQGTSSGTLHCQLQLIGDS